MGKEATAILFVCMDNICLIMNIKVKYPYMGQFRNSY
jgi:hypothetical protein